MYERRRYKVEGGILLKSWDGDKEGWYKTKPEAWAAVGVKEENSNVAVVSGMTPFDWSRKWLTVKSDLVDLGFTGTTKSEAIEWARGQGIEVPS